LLRLVLTHVEYKDRDLVIGQHLLSQVPVDQLQPAVGQFTGQGSPGEADLFEQRPECSLLRRRVRPPVAARWDPCGAPTAPEGLPPVRHAGGDYRCRHDLPAATSLATPHETPYFLASLL